MKNWLPIFLIYSTTTFAASATYLEVPVTYHPKAGVVENVKKECQIEEMLAKRVGDVIGKQNASGKGTIEAGADSAGDQVLRLQITHVLGVGGGAWSGPKAITVIAELLENGKLIRQAKINRWSVGGVFGAFKGTCTILDRSAIAIGKDMGRWVKNPAYKIVEEPAPKDAAPSEVSPPEAVAPESAVIQSSPQVIDAVAPKSEKTE